MNIGRHDYISREDISGKAAEVLRSYSGVCKIPECPSCGKQYQNRRGEADIKSHARTCWYLRDEAECLIRDQTVQLRLEAIL